MKIHPHIKKGFTLVELLVAIAIIAVLASIAVLGTRTALRAADATTCVNSMKSVGTALESMIADGLDTGGNHPPGTFPPYAGTLADDQDTDFIWWELVAERMNVAERKSSRFDWTDHPSETALQNPLSKYKLGGKGEFTNFSSSEKSRGGFAYNAQLGDDFQGEEASLSGSVAVASLEDGARTIVFGEARDKTDNGEPIETAGHYFTSTTDVPQGNYKDAAHCYFYGGSVQLIKNAKLRDPQIFDFYMSPNGKDYTNQQ